MSKIWVDRIEAMAKRRIARTAQVKALPPQPERLDSNLWHLNRRPWMHARYPGMLSRSIGKDEPAKAELLNNTTVQTYITNNYPGITLDELLVMPELPSDILNAIREQVAYYQPGDFSQEIVSLFKPAGYTIDSYVRDSMTANTAVIAGDEHNYAGPSIPAPCILREIHYQVGYSGPRKLRMTVDGYGSVFESEEVTWTFASAKGNTARGLDRWIISGAVVPRIWDKFENGGVVTPVDDTSILVICEPLIRQN